jgi:hypothetical protein
MARADPADGIVTCRILVIVVVVVLIVLGLSGPSARFPTDFSGSFGETEGFAASTDSG